jgi:hypothetical protein
MHKTPAQIIEQTIDATFMQRGFKASTHREAVMKALDEAGYSIVRHGAKCPFDSSERNDLRPDDPCPICGDLGTLESTEQPSRCIG